MKNMDRPLPLRSLASNLHHSRIPSPPQIQRSAPPTLTNNILCTVYTHISRLPQTPLATRGAGELRTAPLEAHIPPMPTQHRVWWHTDTAVALPLTRQDVTATRRPARLISGPATWPECRTVYGRRTPGDSRWRGPRPPGSATSASRRRCWSWAAPSRWRLATWSGLGTAWRSESCGRPDPVRSVEETRGMSGTGSVLRGQHGVCQVPGPFWGDTTGYVRYLVRSEGTPRGMTGTWSVLRRQYGACQVPGQFWGDNTGYVRHRVSSEGTTRGMAGTWSVLRGQHGVRQAPGQSTRGMSGTGSVQRWQHSIWQVPGQFWGDNTGYVWHRISSEGTTRGMSGTGSVLRWQHVVCQAPGQLWPETTRCMSGTGSVLRGQHGVCQAPCQSTRGMSGTGSVQRQQHRVWQVPGQFWGDNTGPVRYRVSYDLGQHGVWQVSICGMQRNACSKVALDTLQNLSRQLL